MLAGLHIVAQKRVRISKAEAERFYAIHRERPFTSVPIPKFATRRH